jgi:hypothetical protein
MILNSCSMAYLNVKGCSNTFLKIPAIKKVLPAKAEAEDKDNTLLPPCSVVNSFAPLELLTNRCTKDKAAWANIGGNTLEPSPPPLLGEVIGDMMGEEGKPVESNTAAAAVVAVVVFMILFNNGGLMRTFDNKV